MYPKFFTIGEGQQRRASLAASRYAVFLLMLCGSISWAQKPPKIDLPPSDTLEVLDPAVSQKGSVVTVSGWARMSNPWAETEFGSLEVSLFDSEGDLIKSVPVDYFPKPIARPYHSSNEPLAFFSVNINVGSHLVALVQIVYHD
jgi:hypothetical protein